MYNYVILYILLNKINSYKQTGLVHCEKQLQEPNSAEIWQTKKEECGSPILFTLYKYVCFIKCSAKKKVL